MNSTARDKSGNNKTAATNTKSRHGQSAMIFLRLGCPVSEMDKATNFEFGI